MRNLTIEMITRSVSEWGDESVVAIARCGGDLLSDAGMGEGHPQKAAVDAVNAYFARQRDKDAAKDAVKESMIARPQKLSDPTQQGYVSKEAVANALEFGDPHAGHPVGEPTEKRAPFHPLSTPVSYSKIVAVTPKQIGLLLRNAEGTDKVVLITGTKVTGERYVRRHVRVREVVDLPDDDTVAHVTDVAADAPRSFRLSGIERAEQA